MGRVATYRQFSFSKLHHDSSKDAEPRPLGDDRMSGKSQDPMRESGELTRRIHILGVGNIGTFVAHSLAGIPNRPPITLLLRRWERLRDYRVKGSVLRLTTHNMTVTRHGFDVEAAEKSSSDPKVSDDLPISGLGGPLDGSRGSDSTRSQLPHTNNSSFQDGHQNQKVGRHSDTHISSLNERQTMHQYQGPHLDPQDSDAESTNVLDRPMDTSCNIVSGATERDHDIRANETGVIHHLIVTVKCPHTVNAIREYAHRLTPNSTILFLQNGMGMIEQVNKEIFPFEKDRPHYMIGILSHGLYRQAHFDVVHAGDGTIALGLLREEEEYPASARYLLRTMTRTPVFVAVGFNAIDLLQQQLDKLAVNAVVNPLTAILGCLNSQVLSSYYCTRIIRLLLAEVSVVFRSLPELRNVPNVDMRFDTARLESLVFKVLKLTGMNRSSMLQDIGEGRQTEIDYINGYVVRRGEECGIHCVTNYMIMQMVKAKYKIIAEERGLSIPLQRSGHQ